MGAFVITFRDGHTVHYLPHKAWDSFFRHGHRALKLLGRAWFME